MQEHRNYQSKYVRFYKYPAHSQAPLAQGAGRLLLLLIKYTELGFACREIHERNASKENCQQPLSPLYPPPFPLDISPLPFGWLPGASLSSGLPLRFIILPVQRAPTQEHAQGASQRESATHTAKVPTRMLHTGCEPWSCFARPYAPAHASQAGTVALFPELCLISINVHPLGLTPMHAPPLPRLPMDGPWMSASRRPTRSDKAVASATARLTAQQAEHQAFVLAVAVHLKIAWVWPEGLPSADHAAAVGLKICVP